MDRRWPRRHRETWEETRLRLVAETSAYLSECLRHPELAVRIPMIPAGEAEFPPSLTFAFWDPILLD